MHTRRTLWAAIALAALVACQTGAGPPQVLSFTADPVAITAGSSSTLRWRVTSATTITIAPGVGDVSLTNATVVTPATTTTYTLTASGAGGSATAAVTVTVDTSVDVAGHVRGLDGRPAPGVLVDVIGVGAATTGVDGGFAIPGVQPPYTIHVRHPSEPLAVTYVGLTVPDPVLIVSGTPTGTAHTTYFSGTVSGGTNFPQPMGAVTRTTIASSAVRRTVDADGTTGTYRIPLATATPPNLTWHGANVPAALHALQWFVGANGLPADYVGHGVRLFELKGGILAHLAQDMAMLNVTEGSVSGNTTVPAGYILGLRTLDVLYEEGGWVVPALELFPGPNFAYLTPEVPGVTIAIEALAEAPGGELSYAVRAGLPTSSIGVQLELPEVPTLNAPTDLRGQRRLPDAVLLERAERWGERRADRRSARHDRPHHRHRGSVDDDPRPAPARRRPGARGRVHLAGRAAAGLRRRRRLGTERRRPAQLLAAEPVLPAQDRTERGPTRSGATSRPSHDPSRRAPPATAGAARRANLRGVDPAAVLALYDHFERRAAAGDGRRVERTDHLTRHVGAPGQPSWIVWCDLAGADVDAVIAGEVAYWTALRQEVEWKHFAHDAPADLRSRLAAAGFVPEEPEALLTLDLEAARPWADDDARHDVRTFGLEGVEDTATVMAAVWPGEVAAFRARFANEFEAAPERTRFYVAYADGHPAAAAWTQVSGPRTPFLGLWGGATLPEHRGRGFYRALVAARVRAARAGGYRYATVDAGPMSAPILERLGFVQLTTTTPCTWVPPRP